MDLYLDEEALLSAQENLEIQSGKIRDLKSAIISNFELLKGDWDSDAGRQFFKTFEKDILDNLEDYANVFEYMSQNLSTALSKYEAVYSAADDLSSVEL